MKCVNQLEMNILVYIINKYNKLYKNNTNVKEAIENVFRLCHNFSNSGYCLFKYVEFELNDFWGVEIFVKFNSDEQWVRLLLFPKITGELFLTDIIEIH